MFQAQVLELPTVAFLVDVFAGNSEKQGFQSSDPPELIGSCYIMPKHFKSTTGWYILSADSFSSALLVRLEGGS